MDEKKQDNPKPICARVQDPFADLPPELRPKPVQKVVGLRTVSCPGCGLVYWTNRKTDLCPSVNGGFHNKLPALLAPHCENCQQINGAHHVTFVCEKKVRTQE